MRAPRHYHHLQVARRTWCTDSLPPSTPPTPTHVRVARLCTHSPRHHLQVMLARAQKFKASSSLGYVRVPNLTTTSFFLQHRWYSASPSPPSPPPSRAAHMVHRRFAIVNTSDSNSRSRGAPVHPLATSPPPSHARAGSNIQGKFIFEFMYACPTSLPPPRFAATPTGGTHCPSPPYTHRHACSNGYAGESSPPQPAASQVDSDVVKPVEFDFYLLSHGGILGTTRPAHYNVLLDENKFTYVTLSAVAVRFFSVLTRASGLMVYNPSPMHFVTSTPMRRVPSLYLHLFIVIPFNIFMIFHG